MLYFFALASGLLLAFSQPPARRFAWQLVAFVPLLWALNQSTSLPLSAALGAMFGLAYALPTLWRLRLPAVVSAILIVSQTLTWIGFGLLSFRFQTLPPLWGALASGAGATFLVWLETQLVPLWGSAQSFARGWAQAPRVIGFVAFTGALGAVWVLITLQALAVALMRAPDSTPIAATLAALILAIGAVNESLWRAPLPRKMRVASLGWAGAYFDDIDLQTLAVHVENAAQAGARILVAPEAAFRVSDRANWRLQIGALAARFQIHLALGYFDERKNINCIDFVLPDGSIGDRYVKTHLVPIYETYTKGSGRRACVELEGAKIGGVICQDDNFSDIARGYGRDGIGLLAVPTNDWSGVQHFHLTSTLWRALEMRFAVARATSDGISVVVSARGEVVARADHFDQGLQLLVEEVSLGNGRPTFYAKAGDWLAWACGAAALGATLWAT